MKRKMQGAIPALRRRRSGSQLVEFALVIPVFLIVLFGIVQYALFFWGYITLRTASAIGARQAIISPGNTNLIIAVTQAAVNAPPMLQSNLCHVAVNAVSSGSGVLVTTVTATYPFKVFIPYVLPPFTTTTTNKTITATTVVQ